MIAPISMNRRRTWQMSELSCLGKNSNRDYGFWPVIEEFAFSGSPHHSGSGPSHFTDCYS